MSLWRSIVAKLSLAIAALVGGLLLCEILLRIQEPYIHFLDRHYIISASIPNSVWCYWPQPNSSGTVYFQDTARYPKPWVYFTNSYGCRYPRDPDVPKPPGVNRILVLGDSFSLGYYYEETPPVQLEQRLNGLKNGLRYEVINCASTSYSPLVEYVRLKYQLSQLQPDAILLNIDLTDVYDDFWRYRPLTRFGPDGEPLAIRSPLTRRRRIVRWLNQQSYLGRFLFGLQRSVAAGLDPSAAGDRPPIPANLFSYHSTLPVESEAWQREVGFCLENIARIARYAKQHGMALTVTTYPHRQQIQPDAGGKMWNREFERRIERLCRGQGVDYFSAFDGIAQAFRAGQRVYWEDDMHFTPEGQRLWGRLISDYYLEHLARRGDPRSLDAPAAISPRATQR